jgi:3-oxoadipate enol-lactonase
LKERSVAVPGGRLHVIDRGDGPPIVLLHAGIVDSRAWEPVATRLAAAGFRVVAFDRRGTGHSITDDIDFSHRDDVRRVMDALSVDRACLVGNSIGGQIAVDVAVESPDRVAALVAVAANVGGFEPEPTPEEATLFEEMERLEEHGTPEDIAAFDLRLWVDGPGQPVTRVAPAIHDLAGVMARQAADPSRVRGRPVPLRPRAAERIGALTMPVLAIAGELDVSDVPATARWLETTVPGARALILPDVGHLVGLEAPERLADATVAFLRTLPAW